MKKRYFLQLILVTGWMLIGSIKDSVAQTPDWTDGEIKSVEIEIIKEREINLPKVNRNFGKIPPRPFEPIRPPISYDFKALTFATPLVDATIRPLKLKQEPASKIVKNYLTLGYGNYASPYGEVFLNSGRDKNKMVGAHAFYRGSGKGPVDDKNSGSSESGVSLYGKTFSKLLAVSGHLDFENRATHFYGYPEGVEVDRDTIRQGIRYFSLGTVLSNTKNSDFEYSLGGEFNYIFDRYDARETDVDLAFKSSYKIDEDKGVLIDANYNIISRKDALVEAKPRNLLNINPVFWFKPLDNLKIRAGLVASYENDTLDSKNFHLYPDVKATYAFTPFVDFIASLTGGVDKVSLGTLTRENSWMAPNIPIYHTNRVFDFEAGLNARVGTKISVGVGAAYAALKNQYYFVNWAEDAAKFTTAYDDGTTNRSNLYASINFSETAKAKFILRADYYSYNTENIVEAWHRPTYRLALNSSYNIFSKIIVSADIIAQGGMKALDPISTNVVNLDAAFDLNARVEYLFSDRFSVFLQFNNITSSKYPLYLNYPVRGFQFMGGLTWSF